MMNEEPEVDEGRVTLCNVTKNEAGELWKLQVIQAYTPGRFQRRKIKAGYLVELKGDVRFKRCCVWICKRKDYS